ncbi:MAG TPA: UDP-glucose 4-epimerase GalE [Thermoleophilia bacterium]|nr:UDP-glucose 4-epimerase GalE [Thermoleophilia bacterium]
MRILVTGGAGYIGSVIVSRLTARGHDVVVYDDLSRGHRAAVAGGVPLVDGDVRDADAVRDALLEGGCEAVVHMAALAEVAESVAEPARYRSVNVDGTAAVLAAARATDVDRLVFSSTAAVYGAPQRTPIDEDDALAPTNPYGETKLAAEELLWQARERDGLGATALRYFNACGADGACGEDHDPESHLVPLALRAARDGTPIRVFGEDYPTPDGTCVRDYVHVADLADAHIAALEALPAVQGAFNLGTGSGDSVRAVLDAVEEVTGSTLRRESAPRRAGDPAVLVAGNRRAAERLGWRPRRSLADAVADAWEWMRAHPAGYPED